MKNTFEKFNAPLQKHEIKNLKGGLLGWTGCTTEFTKGSYNYDTDMPDIERHGDASGDDC